MGALTDAHDYTARARLFGGNRMKLGVMAFNCSHGSTITTVPEAWRLNWPDTKAIAQATRFARWMHWLILAACVLCAALIAFSSDRRIVLDASAARPRAHAGPASEPETASPPAARPPRFSSSRLVIVRETKSSGMQIS